MSELKHNYNLNSSTAVCDFEAALATLLGMTFGQRLRQARKAKGLNQEQLGAAVGVTYGAISQMERDQSPEVSIARVEALGGVLGVSPAWLAYGVGQAGCTNIDHDALAGIIEVVLALSANRQVSPQQQIRAVLRLLNYYEKNPDSLAKHDFTRIVDYELSQ